MITVWTGIAAGIIGTVMALTPTLQILKLIRTKQSQDVAVAWPAVLGSGNLYWVFYGGFILHNWPLIITNTISAGANLTVAGLAWWFRRR